MHTSKSVVKWGLKKAGNISGRYLNTWVDTYSWAKLSQNDKGKRLKFKTAGSLRLPSFRQRGSKYSAVLNYSFLYPYYTVCRLIRHYIFFFWLLKYMHTMYLFWKSSSGNILFQSGLFSRTYETISHSLNFKNINTLRLLALCSSLNPFRQCVGFVSQEIHSHVQQLGKYLSLNN